MELLCCAKLPSVIILLRTKIMDEDAKNGVTKGIGRNGCTACHFLTSKPNQVIKMVEVYNTGKKVQVDGQIKCKTRGVLVLAVEQESRYLGSSVRTPRDRLLEQMELVT